MKLDPTRSKVGFQIRHLGVATVRGTFSSLAADVESGAVRGEVDVASVDTGDAIRDRRLRTEFFAADAFPSIAFEGLAEGGKRIDGSLTIRGATRPLSLTVRSERLDDGAVRLRASGRLRRSDFGLDWEALRQAGRLLVADSVRVFADVVLVRERHA